MSQTKDKLCWVIPVFNEEECFPELLGRLLTIKSKMPDVEMDFIFVNDGSSDKSQILLERAANDHSFVRVISFSRNFGHQAALTAGLEAASGDYVVIIDADLQDPPELVQEMYQKAKEGLDIVYGKRVSREGESLFKKITATFFYKFLNSMCDVNIPSDTGDFRLINKKVLATMKQMREKHRFIRGMIAWTGFKSAPFFYKRTKRYAGQTKYSLKKMVNFALDAIFSFSITPLRAATYVGVVILEIGFLGGLFMLYLRFFTTFTVPGITAVLLTVILIGGVQIIMLGVIGEYLGRVFEEAKDRPLYIVSDTRNF
jgi:glycosyltransferase involved in cell wall biosynthesis